MKNATTSDRLTLVDDDSREGESHGDGNGIGAGYNGAADDGGGPSSAAAFASLMNNRVLFIAVSVACATAAIAAGSYAAWLSRKRFTQDAIMDVHDLLETCNQRMRQMDQDLSNLPSWRAKSA
jgi:hypothetical protein